MDNQPKKQPQKVFGEFYARLRRSIGKDIRWLNSLDRVVKIIGLIFGIALIVGAWSVGIEWWSAPVTLRYSTRPSPRLEVAGVILDLILLVYIAYVIDRDHESR